MNKAEIKEDRILAILLINTWTLTTGRTLRNVPPCQLTEEELINFWADDSIGEPNSPATRAASGACPGGQQTLSGVM